MTKRKILCLLAVILIMAASLTLGGCRDRGGNDPAGKTEWPEAGVYYYSVGTVDCELTLSEGGAFSLVYCGSREAGAFRLDGSALTLDFDGEGRENISAVYDGGSVTLTYGGTAMRMLRKINYTVKFETGGGTPVPDATVLNGKAVDKPADPMREGHLFVGWYRDAAFTLPYGFTSEAVSADITLYARWILAPESSREYTVSFNLAYDGGTPLEDMTTVGGRLFGAPTPRREGYEFCGWWVSTECDPERLSYVCTEDTVLGKDITLFALWSVKGSGNLLPPSIKVDGKGIGWSAVSGARSYELTVTDSEGETVLFKSTSLTSVAFSFDGYEAGKYGIRVTAIAATGRADNSEAYMTLVNRGLDKVSGLSVFGDATLVFEEVPDAERYLVSVICGNPEHNHTDFDNGSSLCFCFAGCDMTVEGIKFVVKAVAEGYITSVSDELVYKRELAPVGEPVWDPESSVVSFGGVPCAEYYSVGIVCDNPEHSHGRERVNTPEVDLKECSPLCGAITVTVYPVADGYISPAPRTLTVNKANIGTPSGIILAGSVLSWNTVDGAAGYEVLLDGVPLVAEKNEIDLTALLGEAGEVHTVSVRAVADTVSAWSEPLTVVNYAMGGVGYFCGRAFWSPATGADYYEVRVNGGEIMTARAGETSLAVTLTRAGENTVSVRFADGEYRSEWESVAVTAYTVVFDTRGGGSIAVQYKAAGDEIILGEAEKIGYDFVDWYNAPSGPSGNAKKIKDGLPAPEGDLVLYAHYKPEKYEIKYNLGVGGTSDETVGEVEYERDFVLAVPTPNEITSSFGGWFSAPYGNGVQYTDESGRSIAPWSATHGMELYAFWIDRTLEFKPVKVNGRSAYAVSAGPRISLVGEITVPAYHNGLPVAMIDANAFLGCTTLKVINIPATVEIVSSLDPFTDCRALTHINVYAVDGIGAPRYRSEGGVLFEVKSDGSLAIAKMPVGKEGAYTLPDGVAEIPESAFAHSSLEKIVIPASVTKIGNDAFLGCSRLTEVVFKPGEGSLTIGKRAFSGCTSLCEITLPARLTDIALTKYSVNSDGEPVQILDDAFIGCDALETISVAEGSATYKVIGGMIYSADGRRLIYCPRGKEGRVEIATGTQTVGAGAFVGCNGITEVFIPSTVTYVGEYSFLGLLVTEVAFEGLGFGEVTIGECAFMGCTSLSKVLIGEGSRISVIGIRAFAGCTALGAFKIPATVNLIRDSAFLGCTSLSSVGFEPNGRALRFGEDVFYGCTALSTVTIPANVSEIPGIFGGCTSLTEVKVEGDSPYFESVGGVIFSKDMTEIIYYPQGKAGDYAIPEGVTVIANGVFSGNTVIGTLTVPSTVSYIGEEAFADTRIGRIEFLDGEHSAPLVIARAAFRNSYFEGYDFTLPSHTREIGEYAFSGVYYKRIILNEGLESLGDYAFYFPNGEAGGTVKIPASVTKIGEYCFSGEDYDIGFATYGCYVPVEFSAGSRLTEIGDFAFYKNTKITAVSLPDTVKVIGNYAFYECSALSSLTLSASLEQIGAYAFAASSYSTRLRIESLAIPASVGYIGAHAFEYCQNLTSVVFLGGTDSPDLILGSTYERHYTDGGVEMVSVERGSVFANCSKLQSVKLSPNVTELGAYCFASAGAVGFTVDIPAESRLTTLGAYCFYNSRLVSITIPASVRNLEPREEHGVLIDRLGIGAYAFAVNSGALTEVIFLKDGNSYPLTIGAGAFYGQDELVSLELPARLAPYASASGTMLEPLADGALVFYGAIKLSALTAEAGGVYTVRDGILYTSDIGELVFCPSTVSGEITVPATVTRIHSYAFLGARKITAIKFSVGTEPMTVGDYAFLGCSGISELILPSNAVSLGEGALNDCTALSSLTLSRALSGFDISVLDGCSSLECISVETGNTSYISLDGVLFSADGSVLILYPVAREAEEYTLPLGAITVGERAFRANTWLREITLPEGLVEIKSEAFLGCSSLWAVTLPRDLELIGTDAFALCGALESILFEVGGLDKMVIEAGAFRDSAAVSVELPARLASLGDGAFEGSGIRYITFERAEKYSLYEIGVGAFKNSALTEIYLPSSLETLGDEVFLGCTALCEVVFDEGSVLRVIPAAAFLGCTSLVEIIIPASVKEIGGGMEKGAFLGCTSLETVIFESDVGCALIGDYAFSGCTALTAFSLPTSVGEIGEHAFSHCTSLSEITIHPATAEIGRGAFESCTSLSTVILNTGAAVLPERAFALCESLTYIKIPAGITEIGKDCFLGSGIERFDVAEQNKSLVSVDGVIYNSARTAIVAFPPKSKSPTLFIPKEVVDIPAGSFAGYTSIREVIFEEGGSVPLSIGDKAFDGCNQLYRLVLPERLVSIGKYAFRACTALTSVNIPRNLTELGDYAFTGCYKLYEVYNQSSIENIGSKGSIKVAQSKVNIYTPTEGASVLFREGDFLFATVGTVKTLIGYEGEGTVIALPRGEYSVADYFLYHNSTVTRVIIPAERGISISDSSAFTGCASLEAIYFMGESAPEGWDTRWHSGQRVIYGYTGEVITYTLNTNGGEALEEIASDGIVTLPTPTRESFVFLGWYGSTEMLGEPIPAGVYYSPVSVELYAGWMSREEYDYLHNGGKSAEDAFTVDGSLTQTIYVDEGGQKIYFKLELFSDAEYEITVTPIDSTDPIIYILDAAGNVLMKIDSAVKGKPETLTHIFTADEGGTVYYIAFGYYNAKTVGDASVEIIHKPTVGV